MSGGSYNYACYTFKNEYENSMYDQEMNDMVKDLFDVLHDLEWWQSADISEEEYRRTLKNFKNKWFKQDRNERLKKIHRQYNGKNQKRNFRIIGRVI